MTIVATSKLKPLATGGAIFGIAMIAANAGNYGLNILLARVLTPAEFADATLMVTLMLAVTSIALCLQLVTAHFVATADVSGDEASASRTVGKLRRAAWVIGMLLAIASVIVADSASDILNTASSIPFVILGAGMPFYMVQAVGRGELQGRLQFRRLAFTFIIEMVARVAVTCALLALGFGVIGTTIGISASFLATWMTVRLISRSRVIELQGLTTTHVTNRAIGRYAGTVSVLLVAQIIANNSDVIIGKAFLDVDQVAGYSAVALMGRAVFFLAWTVATVIFPMVARRSAAGGSSDRLLWGGVAIVVAIGASCVIGAYFLGGPLMGALLGPTYGMLADPMALYAAMTTLFAVANLMASHEMSRGFAAESWMLLAGALLQVVLLMMFHNMMLEMIGIQSLAMSVLLAALLLRRMVRAITARSTLTRR